MRTLLLKWSMVSLFALMTVATASAQNPPLPAPGTPCTEVNTILCAPIPGIKGLTPAAGTTDPFFVLQNDPGVVNLGVFVVPGDVLLLETSGNSSDPKTWSDVVEFSDSPTGGGSIATTFADAEGFGVLVPPGFTPSSNNVSLQETLTGSGSDVTDSTLYTAGTASYQIHSDCAGTVGCELPEPTETPEPSSLLLLGTGLLALAGTVRRKLLS
jgi:hypothetical protein